MRDVRLRELERAWQASGRPQDEAAFLVEAVRAGRLTQDELELAAWARHRAAILALGSHPMGPAPDELSHWVMGLARWGRPLCVRVALRAIDVVAHRARVDTGGVVAPLRAWCDAPEPRPTSVAVDVTPVGSAHGEAWRHENPLPVHGQYRQVRHLLLTEAIRLATAATSADDFATSSANAVVRCEAILGEGECQDPLVALVTAIALRRPEPPVQ